MATFFLLRLWHKFISAIEGNMRAVAVQSDVAAKEIKKAQEVIVKAKEQGATTEELEQAAACCNGALAKVGKIAETAVQTTPTAKNLSGHVQPLDTTPFETVTNPETVNEIRVVEDSSFGFDGTVSIGVVDIPPVTAETSEEMAIAN